MIKNDFTLEECQARRIKERDESIQRSTERCAQDLVTVAETFNQIAQLNELCPWLDYTMYTPTSVLYICIPVQREDLPKLVKAIGKVKPTGGKCVEDADQNTIRVWLESERFNHIRFSYVRPVPENARCRIQKVTRESAELVCDL